MRIPDMYTVTVTRTFSAAHRLRNYKGRCENLHGHNWKVELRLSGTELDRTGLLYDFTDIKKVLEAILLKLDHTYLNELAYFKKINPTSENIAQYIYKNAGIKIRDKRIRVAKVTV